MIDDADEAPFSKPPHKRCFRQRAHCNPLADGLITYPASPDHVHWGDSYPHIFLPVNSDGKSLPTLKLNTNRYPVEYHTVHDPDSSGCTGRQVALLDIGCGFGGLTVALAPAFPDKLILGLEIREKVTNFVGERIRNLQLTQSPGYRNTAVIHTNTMKFLPNYIRKGQIEKMFFCFPDPQFKRSLWRRRIINPTLLPLYAYIMKPEGLIYCITDVKQLHQWTVYSFSLHPSFEQVELKDLGDDPCVDLVETVTEESIKVKREGRSSWKCVFRRLPDEDSSS